MSHELPSGTVTFLFTDVEGSTRLLKEHGRDRYHETLAEHERILRAAVAAHHGQVVDTQGDYFFVAFGTAADAVAAAVDVQRQLAAHSWPERGEVKVGAGLHTGEPKVGTERYVDIGVHRAAPIGAAGHGGQVLRSNTTRELVKDDLPADVRVRDLGTYRLKDLDRPEHLFQLDVDGLPNEFPPLKAEKLPRVAPAAPPESAGSGPDGRARRRRGDLSMDESFFPVVWTESGYRTPWLAELPALDS